MNIISYLSKIGLNIEDLSNKRKDPITGLSERETFRQMEETLTAEMTIDKIKEFLDIELKRLQLEFANDENTKEKDLVIKARVRNYTALSFFIEGPEVAKERLKEYMEKVNPPK